MAIKILVVDDEPNLQPLMRQIFRREIRAGEYRLYFSLSGVDALQQLQANPDIDIILTDINMPNMDGLTLLAKISEIKPALNPTLTPVILSAYDDIKNIRRAMNEGAFDFLIKPINPNDLRLTISKTARHVSKLKNAIEQERKALETLQHLNEELEQRVKERTAELDAFAHTVAHNIKGPLGMILGYVDLLADPNEQLEPEEVQEIHQELFKIGQKSVNIVDELLLLASVRRGNIAVSPLNMAQIIEQVQFRLAPKISEQNASITLPKQWPTALGYAPWIEEVWINYLSNALKYGGQPLHIELGATPQADGTIRFWVADHGPGIPAQAQARLFSEFTRLNEIKAEGHGLGLSIVKRIVEKLGGDVGVKSEAGQGSCFYFSLPAGQNTATNLLST